MGILKVARLGQPGLRRAAPGGSRVKINSVGFYFDSPDVGAFLWSLSRDNDGSFVGMSKP